MAGGKFTREDALQFHLEPQPGKFEVTATVPMTTQRDLSLAYSPGVAVPVVFENAVLVDNPAQFAATHTEVDNMLVVRRPDGDGRRTHALKLGA